MEILKLTDLNKDDKEHLHLKAHKRNVTLFIGFDRIGDIDTMNETYKAVVTIEATWDDSKKIENYNPEKDWNPELYVENILQQTEKTVSYNVQYISDTKTSRVTETQKIKGNKYY